MPEKSIRNQKNIAAAAGVMVFALAAVNADRLIYTASSAIFRLAPGTVPNDFCIVMAAPRSDVPGSYYVPMSWKKYLEGSAERRVQSYLLPEAAGSMPRPKTSFSFVVLEDGANRQVIEVKSEGMHKSWSRYEAYANRVLPTAYGSLNWQVDEGQWGWGLLLAAAPLSWLAGFRVCICVFRLVRWR